MRSTVFLLIVCCLFQCLASAQSKKVTLGDAAWLAGCWQGETKGREVTEQWMKPSGDAMLGMSRTVSKNKMVEYEFLQIRLRDDGEVYFIAKPARQPEASFKLVKAGPREVVFENPQHDFPQRIIYRLESDGSLTGRIEGVNKGKELAFDYPMKRAKCD